jgi:hypothetical protein
VTFLQTFQHARQVSLVAIATLASMSGCSDVHALDTEREINTPPETLFGTQAPSSGEAVDSDTAAVELGVRFQSRVAGQIQGVRFYRAAANAAGYTVHLWTAEGAALATATTSDGALPGWQEGRFTTPVTLDENTTYIASYFASNGRYAGTNGGFTTARNSGDLTAPAGAGVYHYGTSGGFPTDRFQSSNYWVDVQFEPTAALPDTTPPSVTITAPLEGATVAGAAVVTGTARDETVVARVELQVDNGAFGPASGTTSWRYDWNTAAIADGSHTVTVRATDGAGNARTSTVTVMVANGGSAPNGCDRTATSAATLATAWSAATAGQVICLASGSYGKFRAGSKSGMVTVRPQSGATATMEVDFNGANNVRLDKLTITGGQLINATRNITIANSLFTDALVINGVTNANVLLDHNTHQNINAPTGSTPARIHLGYSSDTPSGVTIQGSLFAGGDADGVQTGVGVTIIGNEFRDILDSGPNHTDAIQLLGAPGSVVRGNYIHNCASGIVAYDGVERATIENNVIDLPGRPWSIELYSDDSSVVRHNTLAFGSCDFNLPCGLININRKPADDAGRGTVLRDNVATAIDVENGSTVAARDHNLLHSEAGSGDLLGTPVFVGGPSPTSYAGFRLATGSPGRGAASDGTDIGIP